ncbi:MAG: NYN domain-containing protein [Candidatus Cloacimonetes bacterium]|nr:NYN domain-containing protein [Candidatus Cloacimonadota bacterium]MCF7814549.1 NYN domain-containing protein [Candidatus Cloacimonadota bacterium]MCF7868835.1 NYN domain-containing protein [Candidatus Cloacimonadota bacterium]MCF7884225.1 NYN domain-containing protein [Candidatus Cloacimonadota bacterium]
MKTIVYIDGFNFYYLTLKRSKYKWLDFKSLFEKLLSQNDIIKIKYFTAHVSGKFDKDKPKRQHNYLNALKVHIPEIEIIKGHFQTHVVNMPKASNPKQKINVLKTEEKCTDVSLAVHLVNDGWKGLYDCAVVPSNDGDLLEAMKIVHDELRLCVGLVTPRKARISKSLPKYSTFQKRIGNNLLRNSQLPDPIPDTDIFKPKEW